MISFAQVLFGTVAVFAYVTYSNEQKKFSEWEKQNKNNNLYSPSNPGVDSSSKPTIPFLSNIIGNDKVAAYKIKVMNKCGFNGNQSACNEFGWNLERNISVEPSEV